MPRPSHRAPANPVHRRSPATARTESIEPSRSGMKLVIAIVADADADGLIRAMIERGYPATKIGSTGGFLRRGNTTLLSGVQEDRVDDVIALVRRLCPARTELLTLGSMPIAGEMPFLNEPLEVRAGGAIVFVLDIVRFERV
ncbi:MAG: cyclic-di-AMP receptor [Dehalococcoidia bacterium]